MTIRNLEFALRPTSVAVVGATPREGAIGNIVLDNIRSSSFSGPVYPVNPKHSEIGGVPCFPDASAVPGPVDLIVVATPPATVPGLVEAFGARGTKAAAIITAGFGQRPESLRQQLLDASKPHVLRLLGPNCLGLLVPGLGLNASFAHATPVPGDLALISQSGAIITTIIDWANDRRIGFSAMVSLGDMADVDFGDMLNWFAADRSTRAIFLYVEAITHPKKFLSAARAAARAKPVVVIKSGRHEEAARAAASHTGALAGVDAVYDAAFRRAGILRVRELDEMFDAAETLTRVRPFRGEHLAVLTNGGGVGVMAVDRLVDLGGELAPLTGTTIAALDEVLPPTWSRANPVDIIGDAGPERYRIALERLISDETADAVLVMNCPTALASSAEAAKAVAETARAARDARWPPKPVFAGWLGGQAALEARRHFAASDIPAFATPADAVRGFMHLVSYTRARHQLMQTPPSLPAGFKPRPDVAKAIVARALADGRYWLSPPEIAEVLAAYQIPISTAHPAETPEEAGRIAHELLKQHAAVVVKIQSPDIQHKTDVGGVRLDLGSVSEVEQAAAGAMSSARRLRPDAVITGVTVEPMITRPAARELILGLADDVLFGPVILFGQGGTSVEVVQDKSIALPPLDMVLARDLIGQTRVARLLESFRGQPAADIEAVALTLVKLSQLAADIPEIRELDLNPLLADAEGVIAVDARIRIAPEPQHDRHGVNPRFAIRPYPAQWERTLTLAQDWKVFVRPVRPEDEALYDAFFAEVAPDDMRLRFFTPRPDLSHGFVARLTQIDYGRAMAFVALDPETGKLLGVVRIHADPDHEKAEYAILLRSDLKGRGLGWAMMQLIIEYATVDGLKEIYGEMLRHNSTMLAMCEDLGFAAISSEDDPEIVRVVLTLPLRGAAPDEGAGPFPPPG